MGYMKAETSVTKTRFNMFFLQSFTIPHGYIFLNLTCSLNFLNSYIYIFYFLNLLNKQQIMKCNKIVWNKKNNWLQTDNQMLIDILQNKKKYHGFPKYWYWSCFLQNWFKWVLESMTQNITILGNLDTSFDFQICQSGSGYVCAVSCKWCKCWLLLLLLIYLWAVNLHSLFWFPLGWFQIK